MDKLYKKYLWFPEVPDEWKHQPITFDETRKWYPLKETPSYEPWVTIPCTECDRTFRGSQDGTIELTLHKILKHMKVITVG